MFSLLTQGTFFESTMIMTVDGGVKKWGSWLESKGPLRGSAVPYYSEAEVDWSILLRHPTGKFSGTRQIYNA